jgi:hypothetical protein
MAWQIFLFSDVTYNENPYSSSPAVSWVQTDRWSEQWTYKHWKGNVAGIVKYVLVTEATSSLSVYQYWKLFVTYIYERYIEPLHLSMYK